jgi:hypothetical protein
MFNKYIKYHTVREDTRDAYLWVGVIRNQFSAELNQVLVAPRRVASRLNENFCDRAIRRLDFSSRRAFFTLVVTRSLFKTADHTRTLLVQCTPPPVISGTSARVIGRFR